jgi:hypothetical protein
VDHQAELSDQDTVLLPWLVRDSGFLAAITQKDVRGVQVQQLLVESISFLWHQLSNDGDNLSYDFGIDLIAKARRLQEAI